MPPKRRFKPTEEPLIEKLYRENQESFYGAGGFCDDDDEFQERREELAEKRQKRIDAAHSDAVAPDDCTLCTKPLLDSLLWEKFNEPVCDGCRDDKGPHKLLSRTEVMREYLLKDCDLDLRPPPLRYISRKNPHNPRYGDMKLYLKCQVEQRMLQVHGSQEALDEAKNARVSQKEQRVERNFEKKVKEMRQQIRGIKGVKVERNKVHEHSFGDETYNEEKDEYSKTCAECGYVNTYEKM